MTAQHEVDAAHRDAQKALFEAIGSVVGEINEATGNPRLRAEALEHAALAYRYAAGGSQPGTTSVKVSK